MLLDFYRVVATESISIDYRKSGNFRVKNILCENISR